MPQKPLFDPVAAGDCEQGKLPRGTLGLVLLTALMGVALLGLLGGAPSPRFQARAAQAILTVKTPDRLRSGLFLEQTIEVRAVAPLGDAVIAIGAPLWQDITINSMIPAASDEGFEDGQYRMHYGPLKAGQILRLKIDGQINPPLTVGTRGAITLLDGTDEIVSVPLQIRVFP